MPESRIVAFSTGYVYPFVPVDSGGATEDAPLTPPGDYADSCVGRERMFALVLRDGAARRALIYRLNYAIDLRYGVLHDVARKVRDGEPVDVTTGTSTSSGRATQTRWRCAACGTARRRPSR